MNIFIKILLFIILLALPTFCWAIPPGTLLYRTSSDGKMYGYSSDPLIYGEKGIIQGIFPGHVGIYIGQEDGIDYVVEALADGVVKIPAKHFVNLAQGEEFLGARLPREMSPIQQAKAVMLAKSLAEKNLSYDFDFKKQKGPASGEWTCVGLVEKIYESANISNPNNLGALEYDERYYAVDISPDGFDNYSIFNDEGDCFSQELEFSKIAARDNMILPAPELFGFNAGLEYKGERYIFLPYTQFLQDSLREVEVDIEISSSFPDQEVRGGVSKLGLILKWSLINNPISSIKNIVRGARETIVAWKEKVFSPGADQEMVFTDQEAVVTKAKSSKTSSVAVAKVVKPTQPRIQVNKNINPSKIEPEDKEDGPAAVDGTKEGDVVEEEAIIELADSVNEEKGIEISFDNKEGTIVPEEKVPNVVVQKKVETSETKKVNDEQSNTPAVSANNISNGSSYSGGGGNSTSSSQSTPAATSTTTEIVPEEPEPDPIPEELEPEEDYPKLAIINRVYASSDNDWIELYNPGEQAFDLAEVGYRLEKAKTTEDPGLAMRIGNGDDGSYPGGTVIPAQGYYLIVRDDAEEEYLNKADAIATRDEFGWFNSGYTLYLSTAAVSSSRDVDVIDALGFGPDATYFAGSGPAPAIDDYYILSRVAHTNDNSLDYELVASDRVVATSTPEVVIPVVEDSVAGSTANSLGIMSDDVNSLWHFDECYGEGKWVVGKWECAREAGYIYEPIELALDSSLDLDNFSLSFYYKEASTRPVIWLELMKGEESAMKVSLENGLIQFLGLPNVDAFHYTDFSIGDTWDLMTLVVSKADNYWTLYINGAEEYTRAFEDEDLGTADSIFISGNASAFSLDELRIWDRALLAEEVLAIHQWNLPLYPLTIRPAQELAEVVHFWNFDEGDGLIAQDVTGGADMMLPSNLWNSVGKSGGALLGKEGQDLSVNFAEKISSKDFSMDFWWSNSSYPGENGLKISLRDAEKDRLALIVDYYRPSFWFNDNYGILSEGVNETIPNDNAWHHLALTYDSYDYLLRFYVNGVEERTFPYIWTEPENNPDRLIIHTNSKLSSIDDLRIWQGTLSEEKIQSLSGG